MKFIFWPSPEGGPQLNFSKKIKVVRSFRKWYGSIQFFVLISNMSFIWSKSLITLVKNRQKLIKNASFSYPLCIGGHFGTRDQLETKWIIYQFVAISSLYRTVSNGKPLTSEKMQRNQIMLYSMVLNRILNRRVVSLMILIVTKNNNSLYMKRCRIKCSF